MADVATRSATASDLEAIHHLECDSFPAPWRREFFESELHASGRFSLVATRGGRLIGYVFAMWVFEEMHVNKIAVVKSERRRGIARLLMERCLDFAREHDVATISLEVRESNQVAQDFYRSLDFEPVHIRSKYYPDGESAVVMSKHI